MTKIRNSFICSHCGATYPQTYGRCPNCQAWNSLVEQTPSNQRLPKSLTRTSQTLEEIEEQTFRHLASSYQELDRVLGGGIVPGSLVLIGGEPGIGKSTLLLQVANRLGQEHRVLYVCAEESAQQVKLRSQRLGMTPAPPELYLLAETDLEVVLQELQTLQPRLAVIDSIQALTWASLSSTAGSVTQVRECTAALMRLAKQAHITLFIVGHVTKEGSLAGPKVLEHLVDTVLYFEGDRFANYRLLRSVKNRFGATHELGVFEMLPNGLEEVRDLAGVFLGNRKDPSPGIATIVTCEGSRPLVLEVQALVSPTSYPSPRRSTTGVEYNRLLQILAVLEKRLGIPLSKLDAYVASCAGIQVEEPAADLGIAVAVTASFRDQVVDPQTVVLGEVGLGGQIRPVSRLDLRLKEAEKLGFKRAIIPAGQEWSSSLGLEVTEASRVLEALTSLGRRPETGS